MQLQLLAKADLIFFCFYVSVSEIVRKQMAFLQMVFPELNYFRISKKRKDCLLIRSRCIANCSEQSFEISKNFIFLGHK